MFFPNADVVVNPILLLLLGLIVGTVGGFFGVGGGFLITAGLLVLGVPPIFAVGTGLTLIMGSSLINILRHRELGNIDFKLGFFMVCGTIPAVFLGQRLNIALEAAQVSGLVIRSMYIILLAALGLFIMYDYWRSRRVSGKQAGEASTTALARRVQSLRIPPHSVKIPWLRPMPTYLYLPVSGIDRISAFIPIGVGFGVGFLSGILGAGGGFILMALLIFVLGVPTIVAIGSSLLQIVVTGTLGTFLYSLSTDVDLVMAIIMLASASVGAQLGATATRFVEESQIRVLYGLVVLNAGVAVALEQASKLGPNTAFLSTIASILLLGVSGAICVVIAALLITRSRRTVALNSSRR